MDDIFIDNSYNFVYLADTLEPNYPAFYWQLSKLFTNHNIPFGIIPRTKDIWVRDFMPVHVSLDCFEQFRYEPNYLDSPAYCNLKSEPDVICEQMGIPTQKASYIIDGGNIVRSRHKVILTDKALEQNNEHLLYWYLQVALDKEDVIFVPRDPDDLFGHADGMLRFIDDNTVLVNDYWQSSPLFRKSLNENLHSNKLELVKLPYNVYSNKGVDCTGCYVNFLQLKDFIVVPVYGTKEDEEAVRIFEKVFPHHTLLTLRCNEIARKGGALNCCTWTMFKDPHPEETAKQKKEAVDNIVAAIERHQENLAKRGVKKKKKR